VLILVLDGLIKPTSPGSLIEPAKTYLFPANWLTLPLSFGLLMSPWGGHGVFPNVSSCVNRPSKPAYLPNWQIYRDMRHPYKYKRALKLSFSFTVRPPLLPLTPPPTPFSIPHLPPSPSPCPTPKPLPPTA
jgi:vesicular inhibitory amino acid transporter